MSPFPQKIYFYNKFTKGKNKGNNKRSKYIALTKYIVHYFEISTLL